MVAGMDGAGMARYVVDAVVLEGRSPREVARAHGISKKSSQNEGFVGGGEK